MEDADDKQAVTEWDAQGNPIKAPAATGVTEWDEKGNPITPAATPAPAAALGPGSFQTHKGAPVQNMNTIQGSGSQFENENARPLPTRALNEGTLGVTSGFSGLPETQHPVQDALKSAITPPKTMHDVLSSPLLTGGIPLVQGAEKALSIGRSLFSPGQSTTDPVAERAHAIGETVGTGAQTASAMEGSGVQDPRPAIARTLRDPTTGRVTITPTAIAERIIPPRPEHAAQEVRAAKAEMDADISKGRQQRVAGHAEMTQDIAARTQKAHDDFAAKVKQAEDERQKQLADIGKHESQYGKENADAIARDQKAREAQPISEGPTAPQHEAVRGAQADVSRRNAKLFVPSGENPNLPPKSEAVGPKIFQPGTGGAGPQGRVGNEGSAARFTNESAYNLARKGSREAIMTLGRRGIEPPPNSRYIMGDVDTDRVVYNPREITRFGPTGEALRNMEAPEKGGRSRIIAPDTGVQGTKVPVGPQRFPGGEEKRFTPGTSPTGVERRTQAMQDYQNAIDTTPPGTPTPGEKLAQDTRIAQAGKPSGIEEGDARRFIAQDSELYARFRKLDAAANAGDRAAQKERDSMLVQAMNDLKKIQ